MTFDRQPTLTGELLRLRPLTPEDHDPLFAVAGDPLLWAQHPKNDRYKPDVFRNLFDDALASGGALVAIDNTDDRVIGSSRYHGYDPDASEIEIGWSYLARSHWGGVFNGEMKQLMLDHAFQYVDHVVFWIGPENWRSQRAIEKIGGVRIADRTRPNGEHSAVFQINKSAR